MPSIVQPEYFVTPQPSAQPMTGLPPELPVKILDQKSDDWTLYHVAWDHMHWLYVGGAEIEAVAEQFLRRKAKELSDVYQARVEQFRYQNHVGTSVDWYLAAMFEQPIRVELKLDNGKPGKLNDADNKFYDEFGDNADRAQTPTVEVWRRFFRNLLIYGRSAILVDLPVPNGEYHSLGEQQAAGVLDPFLVSWDSRQMINYSCDDYGALDWVMFSARRTETKPLQEKKIYDYWYYYDRTQCAVYRREVPTGEKSSPDGAMAERIHNGPHALTDKNIVPIVYREVPEGLWLMNRAFSPAKDHLNTDNALGFALYMAALSMPVIKMDGEYTLSLSEAGYIKLPRESDFSWSEPEGKSFTHLADRLDHLRESIFRSFYLLYQARNTQATPAAQSGLSKQMDMTASKKVMNLFGDMMRNVVQHIYDMVSSARGDTLDWDVRGLEFPEGPPNEVIDIAAGVQALDIQSDTLDREIAKMVVLEVLTDAGEELIHRINQEIDSGPSKSERDAAQQANVQQAQKDTSSVINSDIAKSAFPRGSV